ncbi:hypothetical protein HW555_012529 [Spodoptera exigua]|uniref:Zinc finger PHD-type domain-containing protein n=1 Tax=Spodoptera exigua TaxID=7107 RepID=A0A835KYZ4_SPOEX|nr:hypothetical protein HW555_012529 [Spodoptera exigua]
MSEESNQATLWGCCVNDLEEEHFLKCSKCRKAFHYVCLSIEANSVSVDQQKKWICPACVILTPKPKVSDHTPIRNVCATRGNKRQALNSPPQTSPESPINREYISKTIEEVMAKHMDDLLLKINRTVTETINRELKPIREEILQMSASLSFLNQSYEEIVKEHKEAKQYIKDLQSDNLKLKTSVNDLTSRINQLEQSARSANIELQCVPEKKNENLYQIVTKLGRDKTPIFVTEHLSPANKSLHAAARLRAKEKRYKHVWLISSINDRRKDYSVGWA